MLKILIWRKHRPFEETWFYFWLIRFWLAIAGRMMWEHHDIVNVWECRGHVVGTDWSGRVGGRAGWVDEAGKTHLWRSVLEPWSCYGVDIENLFCLGLRRVGFHLREREWQNRKILFGGQSVSLSALPSQEWIWKGGRVGMAMRSVWGWGRGGGGGGGFPVGSLQPRRRILHCREIKTV